MAKENRIVDDCTFSHILNLVFRAIDRFFISNTIVKKLIPFSPLPSFFLPDTGMVHGHEHVQFYHVFLLPYLPYPESITVLLSVIKFTAPVWLNIICLLY